MVCGRLVWSYLVYFVVCWLVVGFLLIVLFIIVVLGYGFGYVRVWFMCLLVVCFGGVLCIALATACLTVLFAY